MSLTRLLFPAVICLALIAGPVRAQAGPTLRR